MKIVISIVMMNQIFRRMKHKKYLRKQVEGEDGEARDSEEVIFFSKQKYTNTGGSLFFTEYRCGRENIVQSFDRNMSPSSKMTFRMCFLRATTTTTRVRELLISRRRMIQMIERVPSKTTTTTTIQRMSPKVVIKDITIQKKTNNLFSIIRRRPYRESFSSSTEVILLTECSKKLY